MAWLLGRAFRLDLKMSLTGYCQANRDDCFSSFNAQAVEIFRFQSPQYSLNVQELTFLCQVKGHPGSFLPHVRSGDVIAA